jgi:hypothetical protein
VLIKKIFAMAIILTLIFSTFFIFPSTSKDITLKTSVETVSFSEPILTAENNYLTVSVENVDNYLMSEGKPMLPAYTKTFTFPIGTKITNIECVRSEEKTKEIEGKIKPTPRAVPVSKIVENLDDLIMEDSNVYSSSELYPNDWFTYRMGCGLENGVDTLFLTVTGYPTRYSPMDNTLHYVDSMDIRVTFDEPITPSKINNDYDMVIIAPTKFKLHLRPLITHKQLMGVKTYIKTIESIYKEYEGRDKPEQIKYFIKDAKETQGITYVLLVGGLKSYINATDREDCNQGSTDWYVPVRYTNLHHGYEGGTISDLYYSDLYRINQTTQEQEFEDWDSNGDNIFADNMVYEEDVLDLYPDVYYGRLACRNVLEVKVMVFKIIRYEILPYHNAPWFRTMLAMGGKTFRFYQDQPDGEWLCDLSLENMEDIVDKPVRLFVTHNGTGKPRPIPQDIIKEFSKGAGFALFQGHGAPHIWDTHWEDANIDSQNYTEWSGGLLTYLVPLLLNGKKLPITVVGGCHNAMFNVTFTKTLNDGNTSETTMYYTYGIPLFECFSWKLCTIPWGGAITSTGCTGFGLSWGHPLSLSAQLENNFFYKIGKDKVKTVGQAFHGSIIKYISENNIDEDSAHYYIITIYQLFGDPSLKIGGR